MICLQISLTCQCRFRFVRNACCETGRKSRSYFQTSKLFSEIIFSFFVSTVWLETGATWALSDQMRGGSCRAGCFAKCMARSRYALFSLCRSFQKRDAKVRSFFKSPNFRESFFCFFQLRKLRGLWCAVDSGRTGCFTIETVRITTLYLFYSPGQVSKERRCVRLGSANVQTFCKSARGRAKKSANSFCYYEGKQGWKHWCHWVWGRFIFSLKKMPTSINKRGELWLSSVDICYFECYYGAERSKSPRWCGRPPKFPPDVSGSATWRGRLQ